MEGDKLRYRDELDLYAIVNRVQTGVHPRALFIEASLAAISGNGTGTTVALLPVGGSSKWHLQLDFSCSF